MIKTNIYKPKDYPYFKASELQCKCEYPGCHKHGMDENFMHAIVAIRERLHFQFVISSAYRCPTHNQDVSTTGIDGPHTMGKAIDIRIAGTGARILVDHAVKHGFEGIGINQQGAWGRRFIHLDMMERPAGQIIWSY